MSEAYNRSRPGGTKGYSGQDNSAERDSSKDIDYITVLEANKQLNLLRLLKEYEYDIFRNGNEKWSNKIKCPFPDHKRGQERSGSFNYNFYEDRFYCFGCGRSGGSVEFISYKDNINKLIVAERIIQETIGYLPKNLIIEENIDSKIDKMMFSFSFYLNSLTESNRQLLPTIDKLTWWLDLYVNKHAPAHNITVEELGARINRIKEILNKLSTKSD